MLESTLARGFLKIIKVLSRVKYLAFVLVLTSCGQVFHYKKFIKKGGKIEPIEKVITITDTLLGKDGKDSLIFRDILIECPEPVIQTRWKTRIELRFDSKRFKDSLKHYRALDKVEQRYALKTKRTDNRVQKNKNNNETKQVKSKYSLWIFLIGLVVGFALPHIMRSKWIRN